MLSEEADGSVKLSVLDNGKGFSDGVLQRIHARASVTTRQDGSGLGLAIVRKIIEDHGGTFHVSNRTMGGAQSILTFPAVLRAGRILKKADFTPQEAVP